MKNIFRFAIILLLVLAILSPGISFAKSIPDERLLPRLVDNAFLLTESEYYSLLEKLDEISERQNFDVVVITVESLEGYGSLEFADDVFDYNGFGMGPGYDGILFLISMEERDWAISTHGFGIEAFTDAGQERMVESIIPHLSNGDFFKGFERFADLSDNYVTRAKTAEPYDVGNLPKKPPSPLLIPISFLIGLVIAFIITGMMKSKLKSVRMERGATSYVRQNSLQLASSKDIYLYNTVTKRARPKESSSSSGGSSTRTSSSGRSHGGSSGKF